jgi:hypothetical protein
MTSVKSILRKYFRLAGQFFMNLESWHHRIPANLNTRLDLIEVSAAR